jgi:hypothetical protein
MHEEILIVKPERKKPFGSPRQDERMIIKMNLKEYGVRMWTDSGSTSVAFSCGYFSGPSIIGTEFLDDLIDYRLLINKGSLELLI